MSPQQHERYTRAVRRMQTGIAALTGKSKETEPKHLRVGVNNALCDHAALSRLLISKGVITDAEYCEAIVQEAEAEADRYSQRVRDEYGDHVTIDLL